MDRARAIEIFKNINGYSEHKRLYDKYADYLKNAFVNDYSYRIEPSIKFPCTKDSLIIFQVRCNEEISFNNIIRNNDFLCAAAIEDITLPQPLLDGGARKEFPEIITALHVFDCTTDPCSPKHRIAHTARQIYRGNVGLHRGISGRTCIRSDYGFGTYIRRTDTDGEVIKNTDGHYEAYPGHFGINIHDTGGFYNTSLGCTVIAGAAWNEKGRYRDEFKPLLEKCSNEKNIPVVLMDLDDFNEILEWEIKPPSILPRRRETHYD